MLYEEKKILVDRYQQSVMKSYLFLLSLQLSKMNFSPFATQFANVNVNQFAKFTQNLATPSQVMESVVVVVVN